MVPDETSDLPTTLPEASFLNPNRKVPSEARSLRGLFPVPVFAEFPSYSLSKNADGFLQNPFWLSYCNLRKLKKSKTLSYIYISCLLYIIQYFPFKVNLYFLYYLFFSKKHPGREDPGCLLLACFYSISHSASSV